jgi:hypothetical protein
MTKPEIINELRKFTTKKELDSYLYWWHERDLLLKLLARKIEISLKK